MSELRSSVSEGPGRRPTVERSALAGLGRGGCLDSGLQLGPLRDRGPVAGVCPFLPGHIPCCLQKSRPEVSLKGGHLLLCWSSRPRVSWVPALQTSDQPTPLLLKVVGSLWALEPVDWTSGRQDLVVAVQGFAEQVV